MKLWTLPRTALGLGATVAVLGAGLAQVATANAATTVTYPTTCTQPVLYQPFLPFLDGNWYSLTPGESYDAFDGGGWTLSASATVNSATVQDGTSGSVLTLPKGAKAVSPPLCVNNTYPYARMMLQGANSGAVTFSIAYMTTTGNYGSAKPIGTVNAPSAWGLSPQVKLASGPYTGWNYAILTIVGAGSKTTSTSSLYNLYLDPRMKH
jgi:hypothetical protein